MSFVLKKDQKKSTPDGGLCAYFCFFKLQHNNSEYFQGNRSVSLTFVIEFEIVKNIYSSVFLSWIKYIFKSCKLPELGESRWMNDFKLLEQDHLFELDEYTNIGKHFKLSIWLRKKDRKYFLFTVIQFGFITLFTIMSPLAGLLALLGNLIGMRISAKNSIVYFRKPLARQVHEISKILYQVFRDLSLQIRQSVVSYSRHLVKHHEGYFIYGDPDECNCVALLYCFLF